ncbi:enoyl-CoA hydratase/isomerase family protein [Pseudochelatococcus contaminans]|uniref:3-hydroxyisobutyryl-CoA hydrolase n=1 Tax=Pseudochelatococcus contaminans TaxID=1538103 RepID=A0A7W6EGA9_9HYPH|nr:enoyl-CoA hydratase/isomerase family protein [Pseudochelatococcus contaminans]MBB3809300.1 enoyl-CoA hydratase [Pseudochelatococcus contaminans]
MPFSNDNQADALVQIGRVGTLGRIHLNRPRALNSLTLEMVRIIVGALDAFEIDDSIAAVLITGEGDRAFCAGGDIRALHDEGRQNPAEARTFLREEYRLNARIKRFPKPYIAFMDLITMGGGVGLSAHGSHRIVTERTRLAMPETGIGFFPDIGATWLLSRGRAGRGKVETGTFLALSGEQIGGADAIHAGLADALVPSSALSDLADNLSQLPATADGADVSAIIGAYVSTVEPGPVEQNAAEIDEAFAFDTVEEIFAALGASETAFAGKTLATLRTRSPTSLKLALRLVRLARDDARLEDALEREYAAAAGILAGHDFYEGVRTAIIDKGQKPQWQPSTLAEVTEESLARYFEPAPERLFS